MLWCSWLFPCVWHYLNRPSGHVFFGKGQYLCQQTYTTVVFVLCHSKWQVEYLSHSSSAIFTLSSYKFCINFGGCLSSSRVLQFPLPGVVITLDAAPSLWAFYFHDWGFFSRTWSSSVCNAHIALHGLQAVVLMLHRMVFSLSGKVVALHFSDSAPNFYSCNQSGHVCFLSRLGCHILNLAAKHGTTLIPACMPTHLNVEASFLSWGRLVPKWHLLPHIAKASFQLWSQLEGDMLVSSYTN